MNDLISRQEAIDRVEKSRRLNHHEDSKAACAHEYEHRHFLKILMDLPPAYPKKGKWIPSEEDSTEAGSCSNCGWTAHLYEDDVVGMPYCPNCGADMRE